MTIGSLTISNAGSAVITDLGRARGPRFGVPVNGALDQHSARVANALAGNPESAPLIEVTALDFEFVSDVDVLLAVTGAPMSFIVNGVEQPQWEPVSVRAGDAVSLREMSAGLRSYVAVHGSFDVPLLLGSCAPDTVLDFGHRVANGDRIGLFRAVAPLSNPYFDAALYNLHVPVPQFARDIATVDVTDGPDVAEFGSTAGRLFGSVYTVGARSNHIGLRLNGPLPERQRSGEVLSRGVPVGAVEVPPGDELLVLHRGRGVTAGYPVLAVATRGALDTLAQVRPGSSLVFRRVDVASAIERARAERDHIAALLARIRIVFRSLGLERLITTEGENP